MALCRSLTAKALNQLEAAQRGQAFTDLRGRGLGSAHGQEEVGLFHGVQDRGRDRGQGHGRDHGQDPGQGQGLGQEIDRRGMKDVAGIHSEG